MITIVMTCYQRFDDLNTIIMSWSNQDLVNEIIIVDNSGKLYLPIQEIGHDVKVISISENMGTQVKYPMALLAKNRWIIYADDDIIALPGLAQDLYKDRKAWGAVGIIGRIFNGKSYYTSKGIRGKNVDKLTKVDWLGGGCTLTERTCGAVEIQKCPANEVDDWWWEQEADLKSLYVVPTKKYKLLNPHLGIHTTKKCKEWREKYYAQTQSR